MPSRKDRTRQAVDNVLGSGRSLLHGLMTAWQHDRGQEPHVKGDFIPCTTSSGTPADSPAVSQAPATPPHRTDTQPHCTAGVRIVGVIQFGSLGSANPPIAT